mmetsp:Transcript_17554/g.25375  ORF Transcript_17554/g.25375 Transcript_17554/m.25375 type:complete len:133 (+) Transcript_17554:460-858(+)
MSEKFEQETQSYPDNVTHQRHQHPLVRIRIQCPYGISIYVCDVCRRSITGWMFHCSECDFDACPRCAMIYRNPLRHESVQNAAMNSLMEKLKELQRNTLEWKTPEVRESCTHRHVEWWGDKFMCSGCCQELI